MCLRRQTSLQRIWSNAFQIYIASLLTLHFWIMDSHHPHHHRHQWVHFLQRIILECGVQGSRNIHLLMSIWIILSMCKGLRNSVGLTARWLRCSIYIEMIKSWLKLNTCYKTSGDFLYNIILLSIYHALAVYFLIYLLSYHSSSNSRCLMGFLYCRFLISRLEEIDPKKMTHSEKLAFWINVHNALMMHVWNIHEQFELSPWFLLWYEY